MENRLWEMARAEHVFEGVDEEACMRWTNSDIWRMVASKMNGSGILKLAATSQWFWETLMEQSVWKQAVLNRLRLVDASVAIDGVAFPWFTLYAINFDGTHLYTRDPEGHKNWLGQLGGFVFDSHTAILAADLLANIGASAREKAEYIVQSENFVELTPVKLGIWIVDLHEMVCACRDQCTRSMLSFDARHIELLATEEYQGGQCIFIGFAHDHIYKVEVGFTTTAAICDLSHIQDAATLGVFDIPSWEGIEHMVIPNGVAVKAQVGELHNRGTLAFFYERIVINNEILSIRVSFVT